MKHRFLTILMRNVIIGAILTPIIVNIEALSALFVDNLAHNNDFKVGFWSTVLIGVLMFGLGYTLVRAAPKNQKETLTSEPYRSVYGVGWPLHTSMLSALLVMLIFIYGLYLNFTELTAYLHYLYVFICLYILLTIGSWIWIKYISKKKYEPKKALSDDNLIRSIMVYRMVRVCICQKKQKGYIPLTRFSIIGIWTVVLVLLPLFVAAFFIDDIGKGEPSIASLFLFACLFYLVQIIVRCAKSLKESHSAACALRRAYCESI